MLPKNEKQRIEFLVITELSKNTGFGNLVRDIEIAKRFELLGPTRLIIINEVEGSTPRFLTSANFNFIYIYKTINSAIKDVGALNYVLIDSPTPLAQQMVNEIKFAFPLSKVIGLDYFQDSSKLDLRISLFDQQTLSFKSNSSTHKVGLDFAILSDHVATVANEKSEGHKRNANILVKFSGGNSTLFEVVTLHARRIFEKNGYKILALNNSETATSESHFKKQEEFLSLLLECSLYIGSGVTTLLECAILETPCFFIGSNQLELSFAAALSAEEKFHYLDPTSLDFERQLTSSLSNFLARESDASFIPKISVDTSGAQRLVDLLVKL